MPSTTNYEHLLSIPRYQPTTVELLGQAFRIADGYSFYCNFQEIFVDHIYKFDAPTSTPAILDCGSNYGTSIVYFKSIYPDAKIIAVEPDPEIFDILTWNVKKRGFEDVTLINKAISSATQPLQFFSEGADGGRTHVIKEGGKNVIEVEPIALDALMEGEIDFLKMDIEGAETEAICSSQKLAGVTQLFIEYHSFQDSEQTLNRILEKLTDNGFRYYIHTQFCSPRPLTEEKLQLGMDLQLNMFAKRVAAT